LLTRKEKKRKESEFMRRVRIYCLEEEKRREEKRREDKIR
jgi:hypothetical protein